MEKEGIINSLEFRTYLLIILNHNSFKLINLNYIIVFYFVWNFEVLNHLLRLNNYYKLAFNLFILFRFVLFDFLVLFGNIGSEPNRMESQSIKNLISQVPGRAKSTQLQDSSVTMSGLTV